MKNCTVQKNNNVNAWKEVQLSTATFNFIKLSPDKQNENMGFGFRYIWVQTVDFLINQETLDNLFNL